MGVLDKLASALGRRDEAPNEELARAIAASADTGAVAELVSGLSGKDKAIQSDCIKVLYEIGEKNAALILPYLDNFAALLDNKNNRLVWGAMTAIDAIAALDPEAVFSRLPRVLQAADAGSVITRDHAVGVLIKLCAQPVYSADCFVLLLEQMAKCPPNQLPMYAENALPVVSPEHKASFVAVLTGRLDDFEKASKRKRVEQVIKKAC